MLKGKKNAAKLLVGPLAFDICEALIRSSASLLPSVPCAMITLSFTVPVTQRYFISTRFTDAAGDARR